MFASVNGVRLHYEIEGEGVPAIVPSCAGVPIYQRTFSRRLREHFRFIFLDLRTSGDSELGPPDAICIETMVADMDAVRRSLGLERVAVIGHSFHGLLAFAYALTYPRHTARIAVIGCRSGKLDPDLVAAYWDTMASAERKALLAANRAALDEDALAKLPPDRAFIARYAASDPERFCDPAFDMTPWWEGHRFDAAALGRMTAEFREYDPSPRFGEIACPVFIAAGWHDYPLPPLQWQGVKERFPDATYHAFERSGHNPQAEEQELFDAKLLAWLGAS
jgi:proline iminopeptidase